MAPLLRPGPRARRSGRCRSAPRIGDAAPAWKRHQLERELAVRARLVLAVEHALTGSDAPRLVLLRLSGDARRQEGTGKQSNRNPAHRVVSSCVVGTRIAGPRRTGRGQSGGTGA